MICGLDEAGRGPVLGPLVVAGALCEEKEQPRLADMGVRDSKKLSPDARERLYDELTSRLGYSVIKISAQELDEARKQGISLNEFEGMKFATIINQLKPSRAYIDCADVSPANFHGYMAGVLDCDCDLVIEHKADEKYPIVSAASIIAKVERDREIELIKKEYGDIGSGYSHDPRTIAFIENYYREKKEFPSFVRMSWKTTSRAKNSKLREFL